MSECEQSFRIEVITLPRHQVPTPAFKSYHQNEAKPCEMRLKLMNSGQGAEIYPQMPKIGNKRKVYVCCKRQLKAIQFNKIHDSEKI